MEERFVTAADRARGCAPGRTRRWRRLIALAFVVLCGGTAPAAERSYSVTDFDRIVVDGAFGVKVVVGPAISVRASGDQAAIDRIAIAVASRTLRIARDKAAWGGWPGGGAGRAEIVVTLPVLTAAMLGGSGSVAIDRMSGGALMLALAGTGAMRVDAIAADALTASVTGSGAMTLGGHARTAVATQRGSGAIVAAGLVVDDLRLTAAGSGAVTIRAVRSARVTAAGAGVVAIVGPAACTVEATGSGQVSCGE